MPNLSAHSECLSEFSHQRQATSPPVANSVGHQCVSVGGAVSGAQVESQEFVRGSGNSCALELMHAANLPETETPLRSSRSARALELVHDANLFGDETLRRGSESARALELMHAANLPGDSQKLPWSSVGEGLSFQKSAPTTRRGCECSRAPQRLPSNHSVEKAHPLGASELEPRGEASCAQERNPNQTSAIPLVLPIRAFLDDVKSLKRGDLYTGRESKQRNLVRSLFATPFKISTFGREVAVEKFANHLSSDQSLKNAVHTLSGKRLLFHCTEKQKCHGVTGMFSSPSSENSSHEHTTEAPPLVQRPLPMYSLSSHDSEKSQTLRVRAQRMRASRRKEQAGEELVHPWR